MRSPGLSERIVALAALGILAWAAHWALTLPPAAPRAHGGMAVFAQALFFPDRYVPMPDTMRLVIAALATATVAAAAGLALFIAWRADATRATRRLSVALVLGASAMMYFAIGQTHPVYAEGLGLAPGSVRKFVLDSMAFGAGVFSMRLVMAFFMDYPRVSSDEDWRRHFERIAREGRAKMAAGWRRRVYPARVLALDTAAGEADMRRDVDRRLSQLRWWRGPGPAWAGAVAAVAAAGGQAAMAHIGLDGPERKVALAIATFGEMGVLMLALILGVMALEAVHYHRANDVEADRVKVEVISAAMTAAGVLTVAIGILWLLTLGILGTFGDALALPALSGHVLFAPIFLSTLALPLVFIGALALSILYRGAVDPRLTVRKITWFGLLGLGVAFAFVLVERLVAYRAAAWLGLPPEWGAILAGALIAATFAPLRSRAEKTLNAVISRWLPLETMVQGQRKAAAEVFCDLSGFTALSARDEKQALLAAALLQRQAGQLAAEHGGRVIKSMGDAVMMTFEGARGALASIRALHTGFPAAAAALGIEPLPVHSGAHFGEVTETPDGDHYGQTVNVAARLQGLAGNGQCVVSEAFAREAAMSPEEARELGPRPLKNVPEPVRCLEVAIA